MAKGAKSEISDPIQRELDSIKRLLVVLLLKAGATQGEIAMALGISQPAVSKMFPARSVSKFNQ